MADLAGAYHPDRRRRMADPAPGPALPTDAAVLAGHSDVVWESLLCDLAWADYLAGRIPHATYLAQNAAYCRALDNHLTLALAAAGYPAAAGGRIRREGI